MNKVYSLKNGEIVARDATPDELTKARETALDRLKKNPSGWAMRSCWNCNPAHYYFLTDPNDGFLFQCVMGCGNWYYGGINITKLET